MNLAPGADPANVRDAIAAAVGNGYTVVRTVRRSASPISGSRRSRSSTPTGRSSAPTRTNGRPRASARPPRRSEQLRQVLATGAARRATRRERDVPLPRRGRATYRIYYGGSPSPIINEPQTRRRDTRAGPLAAREDHAVLAGGARGHRVRQAWTMSRFRRPTGTSPSARSIPRSCAAFEALTDPVRPSTSRPSLPAEMRSAASSRTDCDRIRRRGRSRSHRGLAARSSATTSRSSTRSRPIPARRRRGRSTACAGRIRRPLVRGQQYACGITGLTGGGCYSGGAWPAPDADSVYCACCATSP